MIPSYQMSGIVDLENLQPAEIDVYDIALALARINRFCGNTAEPYSVAQHSVAVSYLVPDWCAFVALWHDGAEAYIGDMPKHVKLRCPEFIALEKKVERVLWDKLLTYQPSAFCGRFVKRADAWALRLEQINRQFRPEFFDFDGPLTINEGADLSRALDVIELELTPDEAFNLFCSRHEELSR